MKHLIAAVAAGIVIFIWGFISWSIMPWHDVDVASFSDQAAVTQVLLDNGAERGIYYIPEQDDMENYTSSTPTAFIALLPNGHGVEMVMMMVKGLLGSMLMALIASLLLVRTYGLEYLQKVGFVTLLGVLVGFSGGFSYYNWFGFPLGYSTVYWVDSVVTWFLAGLVIAKLAPNR